MKFQVQSTTLLKQLQVIGGILNSNNSLPILDNFLFEIDKTEVSVTASDLETTIVTTIPVKADKKAIIAIPAKMLLDTLKTFPETPLVFDIDDKTFNIEISAGEGRYKLTGFDGKEYPKTPGVDAENSLNINSHLLANAINKTLFATGNDDLRPVMSGVYCQLAPDGITFVATDAHKLVRYNRTDAKSTNVANFILPKKPLNLLKGILTTVDADVKVDYNSSNAFFAFENYNLICRLIDGKYPNYDAVIPKKNPNVMTIDRVSFLNSVRRVSLFSNKTTHQVRLKMNGSELSVSAEDFDFNNAANERLTCQYNGEEMEIGFNSKFLVEMLTNLETENVNLEMSAPNKAGILLPNANENAAENILMLVMPVMLNS